LNDLDRIITFIENWTGMSAPLPNAERISDTIPNPIKKLDNKLGGFWGSPPYPYGPSGTKQQYRTRLVQDSRHDRKSA